MRTHDTTHRPSARAAFELVLAAACAGLLSGSPLLAQDPPPDDAPATEESTSGDSTDDSVAGTSASAALELQIERAARLAELASLLELGLVSEALAIGVPLVSAGPPPGSMADDGRAVALVVIACPVSFVR